MNEWFHFDGANRVNQPILHVTKANERLKRCCLSCCGRRSAVDNKNWISQPPSADRTNGRTASPFVSRRLSLTATSQAFTGRQANWTFIGNAANHLQWDRRRMGGFVTFYRPNELIPTCGANCRMCVADSQLPNVNPFCRIPRRHIWSAGICYQ